MGGGGAPIARGWGRGLAARVEQHGPAASLVVVVEDIATSKCSRISSMASSSKNPRATPDWLKTTTRAYPTAPGSRADAGRVDVAGHVLDEGAVLVQENGVVGACRPSRPAGAVRGATVQRSGGNSG